MRRTGKAIGTLAAATSLAMLGGGLALADNVTMTEDSINLTPGGSRIVSVFLAATSNGQDVAGCNASPAAPVVVNLTSNFPARATVSSPSVTVTECDDPETTDTIEGAKDVTVSAPASAPTGTSATIRASAPDGNASNPNGLVVTTTTVRNNSTSTSTSYSKYADDALTVNIVAPQTTVPNCPTPTVPQFSNPGSETAWTRTAPSAAASATTGSVEYRVGEGTYGSGVPTIADGTTVVSARSVSAGSNCTTLRSEAATATYKVDTGNPTITPVGPTAGQVSFDVDGVTWYKDSVSVDFTAADNQGGSGLADGVTAAFSKSSPLSTSSAPVASGQKSVNSGTAGAIIDRAGNEAADVDSGLFNVDTTAPTSAIRLNGAAATNGTVYRAGSAPAESAFSCLTTDESAGSGTKTHGTAALTGGDADGLGGFTVTCTGGEDNVGHAAGSAFHTFTVVPVFSAFGQPINDAPGAKTSSFKRGSTIPVKIQLTGSTGAPLSDSAAQALADSCALKIGSSSVSTTPAATEPEQPSSTQPNAGNCFRYDAAADQFIFNLGTKNMAAPSYDLIANTAGSTPRVVRIALN